MTCFGKEARVFLQPRCCLLVCPRIAHRGKAEWGQAVFGYMVSDRDVFQDQLPSGCVPQSRKLPLPI